MPYKLLSVLLHYPDRDLWDALPEAGARVHRMPDGAPRRLLHQALGAMAAGSLSELQQVYTAAFDLRPSTTLNMTYHRFGDTQERAAALARLSRTYAQAGMVGTGGELPDYLPLMLEFLAECRDPAAQAAVREQLGDLSILADRLEADAPVYAALLRGLAELERHRAAGCKTAEDDAAAGRAARPATS